MARGIVDDLERGLNVDDGTVKVNRGHLKVHDSTSITMCVIWRICLQEICALLLFIKERSTV